VDPGEACGGERTGDRPARRVILIGASNLVIGLPQVVEAAWRHWGRPLEILGAIGHGRSYGRPSRVLWRGLPGILDCGLWEAVAQRPAVPTAALVTDVGNDILYGVPLATILNWVATCLRRVVTVSECVLLTALPMDSVESVGSLRFGALRWMLFPRSQLCVQTAQQRARALNEGLHVLARQQAARIVTPSADWYGLDPIHIRRTQRVCAWNGILSQWAQTESVSAPRLTLRERLMLRRARPQQRTILGRTQQRAQPAITFADGTSVSLY